MIASNSAHTFNLYASQCEIRGNTFHYIDLLSSSSDNELIANTSAYILVRGNTGSRIVSNYVDTTLVEYPKSYGIYLVTGGNDVRYNTMKSGYAGLYIGSSSSNNTVFGNRAEGAGFAATVHGSDNLIYNNYFSGLNESKGGYDYGVGNRWSISKTAGTNIVGGPYLGGNYWAYYSGADTNNDGLGDIPHAVPGSAGALDELPLIGPGELFLWRGYSNPQGSESNPQGQPFPVAQILLRTSDNMAENIRISSMTFTFEGDTNRIPAIETAGLFTSESGELSNLRFLGQAYFVSNSLVFDLVETLSPGAEVFYTLAYKYRYEDEYTAASPMRGQASGSIAEVRIGASITPEDIAVYAASVAGDPVTGWVKPAKTMYITGLSSGSSAVTGCAIETTAEILFAWSLYGEICADHNPAVLQELGPVDARWYLWIKDLYKVHAFSEFANRPSFRVFNCSGARVESQGLPVCEVLDAYITDGHPYWVRGASYANPYAYADLLFDGEVALSVVAATGNYKGFKHDVVIPLRSAFGDEKILIDYYKKSVGGGYYGLVRVLTHQSTQNALAALTDNPRVLDMRGRSLMVVYTNSVGENPMRDEDISGWSGPAAPCVAADYDGDGLIDPAVYDESAGCWGIWSSSRDYALLSAAGWGGPGYEPTPADYDGDGKTDPAVYSADAGVWRVWCSGAQYQEYALRGWGAPGCVPVAADYDGDGRADPAIFNAASGHWQIKLSARSYGEVMAAGWGGAGSISVAADYDGDGKTDPAVYDAVGGEWRVWQSSQGYQVFALSGLGGAAYVAVIADYDGDGKADPAVADPVSGARRIWFSGADYQPMDVY